MEKLDQNSINLLEVSLKENGSVKVVYGIIRETSDTVYEDRHTLESGREVNMDFQKVVDDFKVHVVRDNFMGGTGLLGKDLSDVDVDTSLVLDSLYNKMDVSSIKLMGSKRDTIKIKARIEGVNKDKKGIETGKLQFQESNKVDTYMYWDSLSAQWDELKLEVVKYLNNGR